MKCEQIGRIKMRMTMNLVSVLIKIPKSPRSVCYVNIRRSHHLLTSSHLEMQRERCRFKVLLPSLMQTRKIRVTDPRRALPPILILLLRPISKFITIIFGRLIRKWWKNLTPEEKEIIWRNIRRKQSAIAAFGIIAFSIFVLYYRSHIVETPLTKRRRFIMISDEVMIKISEISTKVELVKHQREIVPSRHPFYQRAARVMDAILRANRDIPEMVKIPWDLYVIDRPDVANAFCTPNGKIFVFTGILNVCTNVDQLAIVMSHEMSHTILSHPTENISNMYLVEAILLIPSFICWIVFTDFWAILSEWLTSKLVDILIHLPFNRSLEREADMVGLFLAARACFDVREAPVFWSKMKFIQSSYPSIEWLSTHPTNESRQEDLNKILPEALELRSSSNCPKFNQ